MTRKHHAASDSGQSVLVIDDNAEYLRSTERLLRRAGHTVVCAANGHDALELLRTRTVDLVLVDYFMPGMTGEEFVNRLRQDDKLVQIILQTGYASEHPPRDVLVRLDIQGYYDKSEGVDKLLLWTEVGLKAARTVHQLEHSRRGLQFILSVTPDMHRVKPLEELLQGVLLQTAGLLGVSDSFVAVVREPPKLCDEGGEGCVAMLHDGSELVIRAGTGRFEPRAPLVSVLGREGLDEVCAVMSGHRADPAGRGTVVPLCVGQLTLGVVYLEVPVSLARDRELLQIFANQAAVAIHNAELYQMAALDTLTGVYTRRFFHHALLRELRQAYRGGQPATLLLVDLDAMKRINDTGGHASGDRALSATGKLLRDATRATDFVGRIGGDEFAVILPNTDAAGAGVVVQRILRAFGGLSIDAPGGRLPVRGSVGVALLEHPEPAQTRAERPLPPEFFEALSADLLQRADGALYEAKRAGRDAARNAPLPLSWPSSSVTG